MSAEWKIGITANHGGRTRAAEAARIHEFAQLQLATTCLSFIFAWSAQAPCCHEARICTGWNIC